MASVTSRPTSRVARWVVAIAAMLLIGAVVPVSAGASTKADLARATADLNALIDKIAAETQAIAGIEADIAVKTNEIEKVQGQISQTQLQIIRLQGQIKVANDRLVSLQHQLDRRAWVAYENGPGSTFEFLLGSTSISDLSDRLEIVNNAAQSDQDLINEMQDRRSELKVKERDEQRLKEKLGRQEQNLEDQQAELQAQLDAAQATYSQLSKDKASAEKKVNDLTKKYKAELAAARKAAAEARARLLAARSGSSGGSTEGAVGHPFSVCPVDQPRGYGDDYGAPRYGGGYHPHAGNDIFAPRYTPIRAPFNGTASDASNSLGGLSVYVHGPDGYTYNAHLQAMGTLGSVSAGTIVGYVGNSGDARGTATHDHFEWHPNVIPAHPHVSPYGYSVINGGIDPWPYLNQVC
jgi:peptidoglycan hydrolase CwlO-like protein